MAIRQITDIVKDLIVQLDFTIKITDNVDNLNGNHVLSMDNTYYLTKLKGIVIDGNNYKVTDFDFNVSITIEPVGHVIPVTVDTFELPAPEYFHGSISEAEREVVATMETTPDNYPIVYLETPIKEVFENKKTLRIERKSPLRLFFVDISNYEDNLAEDFVQDVLKPLSNLDGEFIEVVEKENGIGKLDGTRERGNLNKFAFYDKNGAEKLIFDEKLTAVEVRITLPIHNC